MTFDELISLPVGAPMVHSETGAVWRLYDVTEVTGANGRHLEAQVKKDRGGKTTIRQNDKCDNEWLSKLTAVH